MSTYSLRKAGGSVMVTIPPAYLKRNQLAAGSAVHVEARGDKLVITPTTARVSLSEILASTPKNARKLRAENWDEMPAAGNEG